MVPQGEPVHLTVHFPAFSCVIRRDEGDGEKARLIIDRVGGE